jgi:hypothetical protein
MSASNVADIALPQSKKVEHCRSKGASFAVFSLHLTARSANALAK